MDQMKLLYISALSSSRLINEIYKTSGKNPGLAVRLYYDDVVRLLSVIYR